MAKFGLGKGLGALIPESEVEVRLEALEGPEGEHRPPVPEGLRSVPLGRLVPNPLQPRKTFDEASLEELAASIRLHGIIQPVIVEDSGDGTYLIVAGERRYKAAEKAGLREVPVVVRSFTPEKKLEIALIENVQREDLNPVEEAEAYKVLMEADFAPELQLTFRNMENNSNPWGIGAHLRADWAKELGVKSLAEDPNVEYLFYVGCSGSF
ncbi:MAG TPA: ParB/RepB/Spo0J family partition protein, partial [Spirochaetia bacterium]|nr:ParB/RepB/Spo0J family partition protein [Spirochaetia bacterium]